MRPLVWPKPLACLPANIWSFNRAQGGRVNERRPLWRDGLGDHLLIHCSSLSESFSEVILGRNPLSRPHIRMLDPSSLIGLCRIIWGDSPFSHGNWPYREWKSILWVVCLYLMRTEGHHGWVLREFDFISPSSSWQLGAIEESLKSSVRQLAIMCPIIGIPRMTSFCFIKRGYPLIYPIRPSWAIEPSAAAAITCTTTSNSRTQMTTTPVTAVQDQEDCTESGDFDVAAFSTIATGSCLVQPAATADPALNPLSTPNQEGPPNLADSCVLLPSSYWLRSYQNLEVNPTLLSLLFCSVPTSNLEQSYLHTHKLELEERQSPPPKDAQRLEYSLMAPVAWCQIWCENFSAFLMPIIYPFVSFRSGSPQDRRRRDRAGKNEVMALFSIFILYILCQSMPFLHSDWRF